MNQQSWLDLGSRLKYHYLLYFMFTHVGALFGVFLIWRHPQALRLMAETVLLWQVTGLGVTAGLHRLWAHRSYQASRFLQFILMMFSWFANQGSIIHWVRDHRVHHAYSDRKEDPHNSQRGFFFAHMGWLLIPKDQAVLEAGQKTNMSDLTDDWLYRWQKKLYTPVAVFLCFGLPTLWGWWAYNDWILGFMVHGCLRYMLMIHATFCVNSVAHFYGYRPYRPDIPPAENVWVSLGALGEGWHNYHHVYPYDYATSELGVLGVWNPTKLFIDACCWSGLAWGRKRAPIAKIEKNKSI